MAVELGSGATKVTMSVAGAEPRNLDVIAGTVRVPLAGPVADQVVILPDPTTGASHRLAIVKKP